MTQIPRTEQAAKGARQGSPSSSPLADEEKRRLDMETEQEARRQAVVGQIVRGHRG